MPQSDPDQSEHRSRSIRELPSALHRRAELARRIGNQAPVLFLDYDGTLTPIVDDPSDAVLDDATRRAIEGLRERFLVAVVSGRDLADVREMVGVDGIHYAGSHGFEIVEPDGSRHRRAEDHLPALERCAAALDGVVEGVPGARVERKGFAVAVHVRKVDDPSDVHRIEEAVDRLVADEPKVKKTTGKKVFELRPNVPWDKGRAVSWILETLDPTGRGVPIYLGDDVTDEDAFRALKDGGLGIVVEGEEERQTVADYSLSDPTEVRAFLELLPELVTDDAVVGA